MLIVWIKLLLSISWLTWAENPLDVLTVSSTANKAPKCLNFSGQDIRLGDLVLLHHQNQSILSHLIHLPVTLVKNSKPEVQLGQEQLIEIVSEKLRQSQTLDIKKTRLVFEIEESLVFKDCLSINENYLYNLAAEAILPLCATCRIHDLSGLQKVQLTKRPSFATLVGKDKSQVRFNLVKEVPIYTNSHGVTVIAPVWVTQTPLVKGQVLDLDRLEKVTRTLSLGQLSYLPGVDFLLEGYQVKTSMPASHVLRINDLQKRQLIRSGQAVKSFIRGPMFEIESAVIAKQSGAKDEIIQVQNFETKKVFSAKILSTNEVEIIE